MNNQFQESFFFTVCKLKNLQIDPKEPLKATYTVTQYIQKLTVQERKLLWVDAAFYLKKPVEDLEQFYQANMAQSLQRDSIQNNESLQNMNTNVSSQNELSRSIENQCNFDRIQKIFQTQLEAAVKSKQLKTAKQVIQTARNIYEQIVKEYRNQISQLTEPELAQISNNNQNQNMNFQSLLTETVQENIMNKQPVWHEINTALAQSGQIQPNMDRRQQASSIISQILRVNDQTHSISDLLRQQFTILQSQNFSSFNNDELDKNHFLFAKALKQLLELPASATDSQVLQQVEQAKSKEVWLKIGERMGWDAAKTQEYYDIVFKPSIGRLSEATQTSKKQVSRNSNLRGSQNQSNQKSKPESNLYAMLKQISLSIEQPLPEFKPPTVQNNYLPPNNGNMTIRSNVKIMQRSYTFVRFEIERKTFVRRPGKRYYQRAHNPVMMSYAEPSVQVNKKRGKRGPLKLNQKVVSEDASKRSKQDVNSKQDGNRTPIPERMASAQPKTSPANGDKLKADYEALKIRMESKRSVRSAQSDASSRPQISTEEREIEEFEAALAKIAKFKLQFNPQDDVLTDVINQNATEDFWNEVKAHTKHINPKNYYDVHIRNRPAQFTQDQNSFIYQLVSNNMEFTTTKIINTLKQGFGAKFSENKIKDAVKTAKIAAKQAALMQTALQINYKNVIDIDDSESDKVVKEERREQSPDLSQKLFHFSTSGVRISQTEPQGLRTTAKNNNVETQNVCVMQETASQLVKRTKSQTKREEFLVTLKIIIKTHLKLNADIMTEQQIVDFICQNQIKYVWRKFQEIDPDWTYWQAQTYFNDEFFKQQFSVQQSTEIKQIIAANIEKNQIEILGLIRNTFQKYNWSIPKNIVEKYVQGEIKQEKIRQGKIKRANESLSKIINPDMLEDLQQIVQQKNDVPESRKSQQQQVQQPQQPFTQTNLPKFSPSQETQYVQQPTPLPVQNTKQLLKVHDSPHIDNDSIFRVSSAVSNNLSALLANGNQQRAQSSLSFQSMPNFRTPNSGLKLSQTNNNKSMDQRNNNLQTSALKRSDIKQSISETILPKFVPKKNTESLKQQFKIALQKVLNVELGDMGLCEYIEQKKPKQLFEKLAEKLQKDKNDVVDYYENVFQRALYDDEIEDDEVAIIQQYSRDNIAKTPKEIVLYFKQQWKERKLLPNDVIKIINTARK
ncbi:Hypothetical_protein [Hexamita inflata]|uniref:Hypothetical_protein n=1 Tax=Hexamita inflata TaxID=28002 RepID=A0AA86P6X0_9EUKA|nr:Hypothetical protein HINF_LOCUS20315 [Hexamita inflata]